ncbi:MAG: hypothetical protein Satyrvirus22_13 [Satyrvirus sp.]|uniref:Uncharacterized protein n=1 Tax=Satyrvirus sp. TaxID=2487771 RepID=A0A3G5AJC1_9VIRU|nr:MAG: hypothetical protein Satyrvirus22_13 [Satyrvirus sp.]
MSGFIPVNQQEFMKVDQDAKRRQYQSVIRLYIPSYDTLRPGERGYVPLGEPGYVLLNSTKNRKKAGAVPY